MRQQQQLAAQQGLPYEGYEPGTASSINYDVITLPSGRRLKFQPEKLTIVDVRSCTEPWALSGIAKWIREMAEGEPDLKRKTLEDGLVRLFCLKVPTMNVADAEALIDHPHDVYGAHRLANRMKAGNVQVASHPICAQSS